MKDWTLVIIASPTGAGKGWSVGSVEFDSRELATRAANVIRSSNVDCYVVQTSGEPTNAQNPR